MSYAETLDRYTPYALAALRIVTALIFMEHGTQKLFGFPAPPQGGQPLLLSLYGIGGILEVVGGLLILIGLFTRPVAFLLAGEMAVAYWMFHAPRSFYPLLNGGDAAILYCFIFLLLLFTGPGAWSVDRTRERRSAVFVGWAKAHLVCRGGHASLCPPYDFATTSSRWKGRARRC